MSTARHSVARRRPFAAALAALLVATVVPWGSSAVQAAPAAGAPLSAARPVPLAAAASVAPARAGVALVRTPTNGHWMFAVQANGHIFQMVRGSGNWFAPHDLGGPFIGGPAATYLANGNRIDLFAVYGDGSLKTSIFAQGRWSPWVRIASGFAAGTVSAVRMPDGTIRVFGVSSAGSVRQAARVNGTWSVSSLGGTSRGTSATYDAATRAVHLFTVGADGRIRHRQVINHQWSGWTPATVATGFVGVSATMVSGTLKVYAVHSNGNLMEFARASGRWGTPRSLGAGLIGTPAAQGSSSEIRVLANRSDGRLVERIWRGSWSAWTNLPAAQVFPRTAPPPPTRVTLAKLLLSRWGGRLTGLPGVKADLEATAAGRGIRNSDSCGNTVYLHPQMLQTIVAATDKYQVLVNNMVTGHGCDSGQHPKGTAVDFNTVVDPATGRRTNWHSGESGDNIGLDVEFLTRVASVVTSGGGAGQRYCAGRSQARLPAGMIWFDDYCNHQHIDVRGGG